MKTRFILLSIFSFILTSSAFAQVENDDMYFNSKDRAKLNEERAKTLAYTAVSKDNNEDATEEADTDDADTYTSRNVNPEYISRSNSQTAQADNQDYYISNY